MKYEFKFCLNFCLFQMDEVLEKFLEDQKMKIAEEKACLEQDPPYMEIRVRYIDVIARKLKIDDRHAAE